MHTIPIDAHPVIFYSLVCCMILANAHHSFLHTAYTYEAYFDEILEDDNPLMEAEEMPSYSSHPPTSLPLSLRSEDNAPLHCEMEKRVSKDSGTGPELEELTPYARMSSSGMNSDSGLDTPYMAEGQILSGGKSIFTFASHPEESSAEYIDTDHRGKGWVG